MPLLGVRTGWSAVVIMIGAVAWLVERLVLRPLVNQEPIILFMATIGLAYFLDGFGQTVWGSDVYEIDLGLPKEPVMILETRVRRRHPGEQRGHRRGRDRRRAGGRAGAVLPEDPTGRALRAVADDHQAAQSVGIPLQPIWVIVWSIAGIVALVAGVMWGAKLGRAVLAVADRAEGAAGADPRRLHLDPGRHRRRADHRRGREAGRGVPAPVMVRLRSAGGGIENWFAYVLALVFLLVRPEGLFGEKTSSSGCRSSARHELTPHMLYRENGQFKTTYAADQQMFPIRQDRMFVLALLAVAFLVVPLVASDYLLRAILIPFLIWRSRRSGSTS